MRYAIREEPTTLDPHLCFSAGTMNLLANSFESLVTYGESNQLIPILAESLPERSADGKTFTVRLRKNVRFHDGTPLNSDAVRINALRILSKTLVSPRATLTLDDLVGAKEWMAGTAKDLPGVQIVDEHTIRFTIAEPRAYFLDKLTTFYLISPAAISKAPANERGVGELDVTCAIGTGPFKITEYHRQSHVIQMASADYWGDKPLLTSIERPILIDAKTARNLYDTGELDLFVESVADYDADRSSPVHKSEMQFVDQCGLYFITLNTRTFAPFQDKRVRQALSRAMDRDAIADKALLGMYPAATGILAPGTMGAGAKGDRPEVLKSDPDVARKLLAAAGYGPSKPLTFTLLYSEGSVTAPKIAQVLKEQWEPLGVNLNLQEVEWGTMLKRMQNHEFDATYAGWTGSPDPHDTLYTQLDSTSPLNHGAYSSAAFDAASRAADQELDNTKRAELCRKAVAIALDDEPILPIVFIRDVSLVRSYVTGLRYSLVGMLPHTKTKVV